MLPAYVLALREGLEAALIIGIVLGALQKMRRNELAPVVWIGAGTAVVISLIVALILQWLGTAFEGRAEEIFEGTTMFLAAGVLTWMIFWMRRQARNIKGELETNVRRAALQTGGKALFLLATLAVLREGIEMALFFTAASLAADPQQALTGALLGLGTAILLGWSLFASIVRLDLRRFFQVTGILLLVFAAGLIAHGVHEFNEVGWIPGIIEQVWNTNSLVNESSFTGQLLTVLFGYNGNPSLTEVIAYWTYFAIIGLSLWLSRSPLPATQKPDAA
jgi:high-affinity iron transporter